MPAQAPPNKPLDPHSAFITHPNGQTTHYISDNFTDPWTKPETILIQHGFARHANFWYHWVPALARQYRVIRRDARGHGLSSYPEPGSSNYAYTLDTILDEIIDHLNQLHIDKVHFLGESTSGMIGEALAAKHPSRVASLTICSAPPFLPPAALNLFAFGHSSWPAACRELGSRGWGTALASKPGTMATDDPAYKQWWIDQVAISDGEGLAGYAEFLSTLDGRPFLKEIKAPMLILAPTRSAATTLDDQNDIARQVPGGAAKVVPIDGLGHEIYTDMAEECQRVLLEFLRGLK